MDTGQSIFSAQQKECAGETVQSPKKVLLRVCKTLQSFNSLGCCDTVGLLFVGSIGGKPAERAAKTALSQTEDLGFILFVFAAGINGLIP